MADILSLSGLNAADPCACEDLATPGIAGKLRLVPQCEVVSFPPLLSDTVNATGQMSDKVTLDGDIILNSTTPNKGYWREYDIVIYKGGVDYNATGEKGSKSFNNDVAFSIAGTDADRRGFAACMLNCPYVAEVTTKAGEEWVIGDDEVPAEIESIAGSTGKTAEDFNGADYVLRANNSIPPYTYNGVID